MRKMARTSSLKSDRHPPAALPYQKEFTAKASTYYLKEITAPKGYTLSSEIRAVDIVGGEIVDAGTFEDQKEENSAFIEVTKVSADDANKKLAGAVFAIYDNEACSGEPVQIMDPTDENGYSKSKELLVTKRHRILPERDHHTDWILPVEG